MLPIPRHNQESKKENKTSVILEAIMLMTVFTIQLDREEVHTRPYNLHLASIKQANFPLNYHLSCNKDGVPLHPIHTPNNTLEHVVIITIDIHIIIKCICYPIKCLPIGKSRCKSPYALRQM